jgi:hypothetical protein
MKDIHIIRDKKLILQVICNLRIVCKYCIIVLNLIQLFLYIDSEIFNAVYI